MTPFDELLMQLSAQGQEQQQAQAPGIALPEEDQAKIKLYNRYRQLQRLYVKKPELFSDQAVQELENLAQELGEQFDPYPTPQHAVARGLKPDLNEQYTPQGESEFDFWRTLGQGGRGFIEGITGGLGEMGDKPQNQTEHIARNIGNLLGFIGVPIGEAGGAMAGLRHLSVPSLFGFGASKGLAALLEKASPNLGRLLQAGMFAEAPLAQRLASNVIMHGVSLGAASIPPAIKYGVDEALAAFAHGAMFGGGFGALGAMLPRKDAINLIKLFKGEQKVNSKDLARAVGGAIWQGLPSTLQKQSTPDQIYEYLMGAWFGFAGGETPSAVKMVADEAAKSLNMTKEQREEVAARLAALAVKRKNKQEADKATIVPQESEQVDTDVFKNVKIPKEDELEKIREKSKNTELPKPLQKIKTKLDKRAEAKKEMRPKDKAQQEAIDVYRFVAADKEADSVVVKVSDLTYNIFNGFELGNKAERAAVMEMAKHKDVRVVAPYEDGGRVFRIENGKLKPVKEPTKDLPEGSRTIFIDLAKSKKIPGKKHFNIGNESAENLILRELDKRGSRTARIIDYGEETTPKIDTSSRYKIDELELSKNKVETEAVIASKARDGKEPTKVTFEPDKITIEGYVLNDFLDRLIEKNPKEIVRSGKTTTIDTKLLSRKEFVDLATQYYHDAGEVLSFVGLEKDLGDRVASDLFRRHDQVEAAIGGDTIVIDKSGIIRVGTNLRKGFKDKYRNITSYLFNELSKEFPVGLDMESSSQGDGRSYARIVADPEKVDIEKFNKAALKTVRAISNYMSVKEGGKRVNIDFGRRIRVDEAASDKIVEDKLTPNDLYKPVDPNDGKSRIETKSSANVYANVRDKGQLRNMEEARAKKIVDEALDEAYESFSQALDAKWSVEEYVENFRKHIEQAFQKRPELNGISINDALNPDVPAERQLINLAMYSASHKPAYHIAVELDKDGNLVVHDAHKEGDLVYTDLITGIPISNRELSVYTEALRPTDGEPGWNPEETIFISQFVERDKRTGELKRSSEQAIIEDETKHINFIKQALNEHNMLYFTKVGNGSSPFLLKLITPSRDVKDIQAYLSSKSEAEIRRDVANALLDFPDFVYVATEVMRSIDKKYAKMDANDVVEAYLDMVADYMTGKKPWFDDTSSFHEKDLASIELTDRGKAYLVQFNNILAYRKLYHAGVANATEALKRTNLLLTRKGEVVNKEVFERIAKEHLRKRYRRGSHQRKTLNSVLNEGIRVSILDDNTVTVNGEKYELADGQTVIKPELAVVFYDALNLEEGAKFDPSKPVAVIRTEIDGEPAVVVFKTSFQHYTPEFAMDYLRTHYPKEAERLIKKYGRSGITLDVLRNEYVGNKSFYELLPDMLATRSGTKVLNVGDAIYTRGQLKKTPIINTPFRDGFIAQPEHFSFLKIAERHEEALGFTRQITYYIRGGYEPLVNAILEDITGPNVALANKALDLLSRDPRKFAEWITEQIKEGGDAVSLAIRMMNNGLTPIHPAILDQMSRYVSSPLVQQIGKWRMEDQFKLDTGIDYKGKPTGYYVIGADALEGVPIRIGDHTVLPSPDLPFIEEVEVRMPDGTTERRVRLKDGYVLLPHYERQKFPVGSKILVYRPPVYGEPAVITMEVAGHLPKEMGNNAIINAKAVFERLQGDFDIDTIYTIGNLDKEVLDFFTIREGEELRDFKQRIAARGGSFNSYTLDVRKVEYDDEAVMKQDPYNYMNTIENIYYLGLSSRVIGQVQNLKSMYRAMSDNEVEVDLGTVIDSKGQAHHIVVKVEMDDVVDRRFSSIMQQAIDDVKSGGVIGRKKLPTRQGIIDNPNYFHPKEKRKAFRMMSKIYVDGKPVEFLRRDNETFIPLDRVMDFNADQVRAIVDSAAAAIEGQMNIYLKKHLQFLQGQDPATGMTLTYEELRTLKEEIDMVRTGELSIEALSDDIVRQIYETSQKDTQKFIQEIRELDAELGVMRYMIKNGKNYNKLYQSILSDLKAIVNDKTTSPQQKAAAILNYISDTHKVRELRKSVYEDKELLQKYNESKDAALNVVLLNEELERIMRKREPNSEDLTNMISSIQEIGESLKVITENYDLQKRTVNIEKVVKRLDEIEHIIDRVVKDGIKTERQVQRLDELIREIRSINNELRFVTNDILYRVLGVKRGSVKAIREEARKILYRELENKKSLDPKERLRLSRTKYLKEVGGYFSLERLGESLENMVFNAIFENKSLWENIDLKQLTRGTRFQETFDTILEDKYISNAFAKQTRIKAKTGQSLLEKTIADLHLPDMQVDKKWFDNVNKDAVNILRRKIVDGFPSEKQEIIRYIESVAARAANEVEALYKDILKASTSKDDAEVAHLLARIASTMKLEDRLEALERNPRLAFNYLRDFARRKVLAEMNVVLWGELNLRDKQLAAAQKAFLDLFNLKLMRKTKYTEGALKNYKLTNYLFDEYETTLLKDYSDIVLGKVDQANLRKERFEQRLTDEIEERFKNTEDINDLFGGESLNSEAWKVIEEVWKRYPEIRSDFHAVVRGILWDIYGRVNYDLKNEADLGLVVSHLRELIKKTDQTNNSKMKWAFSFPDNLAKDTEILQENVKFWDIVLRDGTRVRKFGSLLEWMTETAERELNSMSREAQVRETRLKEAVMNFEVTFQKPEERDRANSIVVAMLEEQFNIPEDQISREGLPYEGFREDHKAWNKFTDHQKKIIRQTVKTLDDIRRYFERRQKEHLKQVNEYLKNNYGVEVGFDLDMIEHYYPHEFVTRRQLIEALKDYAKRQKGKTDPLEIDAWVTEFMNKRQSAPVFTPEDIYTLKIAEDVRAKNPGITGEELYNKVYHEVANRIPSISKEGVERLLRRFGANFTLYKSNSYTMARKMNLRGYSRDWGVVFTNYIDKMTNKMTMDRLAQIFDRELNIFAQTPSKVMSEQTKQRYLKYLKNYARAIMGLPMHDVEVLGVRVDDYANADRAGKLVDLLSKTPGFKSILKKFNITANDVSPYTIRTLAQLEAKLELMTILNTITSFVNNVGGGGMNLIIAGGLRRLRQAWRLRDSLITNMGGVNMSDEAREMLSKEFGYTKDFNIITEVIGSMLESDLIRSFQKYELDIRGKLSDASFRTLKSRWMSMSDKELLEFARKNGLGKSFSELFINMSGKFMTRSERLLRHTAMIQGVLHAIELGFTDRVMIQRWAEKMVRRTQFDYSNLYSPEFRRTTIGQILTRFMTVTWRNMDFRRTIIQEAKRIGLDVDSQQKEQMVRMFAWDSLFAALAFLLPFSIFNKILPQPMQVLTDLAASLYNEDDEEDILVRLSRGEFGTNLIVSPMVSRTMIAPIVAMMNSDFSYPYWSWIPFGRFTKQITNTIKYPKYGLDNLVGFPAGGIHDLLFRRDKKEKVENVKRRMFVNPYDTAHMIPG